MKHSLILISVLFIFSFSEAAILSVATGGSQTYTQVQPAVNQASAGDTIMVFPGSYNGFIVDRHLVIIGAGTNTTGDGTKIVGVVEVYDAADSTELRSLWIQAATALTGTDSTMSSLVIHSGASAILIWRSFIENNASGSNDWYPRCVYAGNSTSTQWVQCIFWPSGSSRDAFRIETNSSAILASCVFSNIGAIGISGSSGTTVIARHCVFSGSNNFSPFSVGTYGSAVNCAFLTVQTVNFTTNMDYAYSAGQYNSPPGTTNFTTTGGAFQNFVILDNPRTTDYHLATTSNLRDAGNPDDPTDLDGSRADLGIYGGQHPFVDGGIPDYPFVIRLEAPYSVPQDGVMRIWARGQVGPGY